MNRRTNLSSLLSAGIGLALFAIPQILFFSLAPQVACRMTVYGFMTGFTLLHLLLCFFLRWQRGVRIAAAPIHLSTVLLLVEYVVSAVLLATAAAPLTAMLLLLVVGLIHFLAVAVLYTTLEA